MTIDKIKLHDSTLSIDAETSLTVSSPFLSKLYSSFPIISKL